jgi:sulfide:quinone oxidoreductase
MAARVLIAGAGVAALEAALALRDRAQERVQVELLGTEPHFWYRPLSVAEPFETAQTIRHGLPALAVAAGARFNLGTFLGTDAAAGVARTSIGDIAYDFLLVAVGAIPYAAVAGALTFRGPADSDKVESLVGEVAAADVRRVAFARPAGAAWSLPLYELALMTAARLAASGVEDVELILVTPETEPLEGFGGSSSEEVRRLLDERRIDLHTGREPIEFRDGALRLVSEEWIEVDRVVAVPRLRGALLDGLPQSADGFIQIDRYARVRPLENVYAAGDIVDFPLKLGGIAAQLADAAAASIASRVGAAVVPEPFRPVPRAVLLTGGPRLSLGAERSPPPAGKITGRYLTPFLERVGAATAAGG